MTTRRLLLLAVVLQLAVTAWLLGRPSAAPAPAGPGVLDDTPAEEAFEELASELVARDLSPPEAAAVLPLVERLEEIDAREQALLQRAAELLPPEQGRPPVGARTVARQLEAASLSPSEKGALLADLEEVARQRQAVLRQLHETLGGRPARPAGPSTYTLLRRRLEAP